jgi:hypothetical protein
MASDSITLPLDVAVERSGFSEAASSAGAVYFEGAVCPVQVFRRIMPDREPELAVVIPRVLVTAPTHPLEKYDVRLATPQDEGDAEDRAHDADAKTHDQVGGQQAEHEGQEQGEQDQRHVGKSST